MRIVELNGPVPCRNPVVTVGTFDGVHVGHQAVLEALRYHASAQSAESAVVTFDPHPRQVIAPDRAPPLLTTVDERAWRIEEAGIDVLAVVAFDHGVRSLEPSDFVLEYLVGYLSASAVVLGHDHGFGRDRSGDVDTLERLGETHGFGVHSVAATDVGGEPVSSTRIRRTIASGDLDIARPLLGGGYPVVGEVVPGDRRGRQIGFPTANVQVDTSTKLMPRPGVYAGRAVTAGGTFDAVVNFGSRPTFDGAAQRFEAHLLDFEGDLYGTKLKLELVHRLRDEAKFESLTQLIHQITTDVDKARALLGRHDLSTRR